MAISILEIGNGKKIAVNDYGVPDGKVIVINHGMIASINDESLFTRLIEYGYRIISIARPGYGQTSAFKMENIGE